MILYGLMANESVGKLFMGGVFPGILLSFMFIAYIGIRCYFQPNLGPAVVPEERATWGEKIASLKSVILPILLIALVMGTIYGGICTPSEAAGVGAFGSLVCAAIYRKLNWKYLKEVCYATLGVTGMVMWIGLAGFVFTSVYMALGAPQLLQDVMGNLPGGRWGLLAAIQLSFFILGMFLDPLAIMMITVPLYVPLIKAVGFDTVWFGVLFVVNMEMAYVTPPYGFNLFYLKGVAPKDVTIADIYRSIVPFVLIQASCLVILILFPQIVLWLPNTMTG